MTDADIVHADKSHSFRVADPGAIPRAARQTICNLELQSWSKPMALSPMANMDLATPLAKRAVREDVYEPSSSIASRRRRCFWRSRA
jgi:hypothetical protein